MKNTTYVNNRYKLTIFHIEPWCKIFCWSSTKGTIRTFDYKGLRYQLHPFLPFYQWLNSIQNLHLSFPAIVCESRWYFLKSSLSSSLVLTPCYYRLPLFIQYILEDTIKPHWFLVQVNHHETDILKMDLLHTWDYHVTFFSRYPDDKYFVMMLPIDGLSCTSIIWIIQIFLYMVLVCFLAKDGHHT